MNNPILRQDRIIFASLMGDEVSIIFVEATHTVAKAAGIHHTSPVCTSALGRTIIATAMIAARIKDDKSSVTVTVNGGGPIGQITAVSNGKEVKGLVGQPKLDLPSRPDGKLNVGAAVGNQGYISVVKDLQMKNPYIGQTELINGELGEDFSYYFAKSEQQPCLLSLGVLVHEDTVLSAGGILIMPMPGCSEETLEKLEMRAMLPSDISRELTFEPAEDLIERWFGDMEPHILESQPLSYTCNCSREKMEKALLSLGEKELRSILADEQEGAELVCHFCHNKYQFSDADIENLIEKGLEQ